MGRNELARSYHSRAMIMTSGETLPRGGDSLLARLFIVQISKGDIDSSEFSQMQQCAAAGLFENAMGGYVSYPRQSPNRHDASQLKAVLANKIAEPIMEAEPENLCADAGYAGEAPCKVMLAAGYKPHVRPRGEEQREKLRTW